MPLQEVNPLDRLAAYVAKFPSQGAAAKALNVSPAHMCDLLRGHRNLTPRHLAVLGLRAVVVEDKASKLRK